MKATSGLLLVSASLLLSTRETRAFQNKAPWIQETRRRTSIALRALSSPCSVVATTTTSRRNPTLLFAKASEGADNDDDDSNAEKEEEENPIKKKKTESTQRSLLQQRLSIEWKDKVSDIDRKIEENKERTRALNAKSGNQLENATAAKEEQIVPSKTEEESLAPPPSFDTSAVYAGAGDAAEKARALLEDMKLDEWKFAPQAGVNVTTYTSVGVSVAVLSVLWSILSGSGSIIEKAFLTGVAASYLTVTDNPVGDALRSFGDAAYDVFRSVTEDEAGGKGILDNLLSNVPNVSVPSLPFADQSFGDSVSEIFDDEQQGVALSSGLTTAIAMTIVGVSLQFAILLGLLAGFAAGTMDGVPGDSARLIGEVGRSAFFFGKNLVDSLLEQRGAPSGTEGKPPMTANTIVSTLQEIAAKVKGEILPALQENVAKAREQFLPVLEEGVAKVQERLQETLSTPEPSVTEESVSASVIEKESPSSPAVAAASSPVNFIEVAEPELSEPEVDVTVPDETLKPASSAASPAFFFATTTLAEVSPVKEDRTSEVETDQALDQISEGLEAAAESETVPMVVDDDVEEDAAFWSRGESEEDAEAASFGVIGSFFAEPTKSAFEEPDESLDVATQSSLAKFELSEAQSRLYGRPYVYIDEDLVDFSALARLRSRVELLEIEIELMNELGDISVDSELDPRTRLIERIAKLNEEAAIAPALDRIEALRSRLEDFREESVVQFYNKRNLEWLELPSTTKRIARPEPTKRAEIVEFDPSAAIERIDSLRQKLDALRQGVIEQQSDADVAFSDSVEMPAKSREPFLFKFELSEARGRMDGRMMKSSLEVEADIINLIPEPDIETGESIDEETADVASDSQPDSLDTVADEPEVLGSIRRQSLVKFELSEAQARMHRRAIESSSESESVGDTGSLQEPDMTALQRLESRIKLIEREIEFSGESANEVPLNPLSRLNKRLAALNEEAALVTGGSKSELDIALSEATEMQAYEEADQDENDKVLQAGQLTDEVQSFETDPQSAKETGQSNVEAAVIDLPSETKSPDPVESVPSEGETVGSEEETMQSSETELQSTAETDQSKVKNALKWVFEAPESAKTVQSEEEAEQSREETVQSFETEPLPEMAEAPEPVELEAPEPVETIQLEKETKQSREETSQSLETDPLTETAKAPEPDETYQSIVETSLPTVSDLQPKTTEAPEAAKSVQSEEDASETVQSDGKIAQFDETETEATEQFETTEAPDQAEETTDQSSEAATDLQSKATEAPEPVDIAEATQENAAQSSETFPQSDTNEAPETAETAQSTKTPGEAGSVEIYVANLDSATNEEFLREIFEEFGSVENLYLPRDENGRMRGFGFVTMNRQDGAAAITNLDGVDVDGKIIRVSEARGGSEAQVEDAVVRLRVGNLSYNTRKQDVANLFETIGPVLGCSMPRGRGRRFCFVDMPKIAAEQAIQKLNMHKMDGWPILISRANPYESEPL